MDDPSPATAISPLRQRLIDDMNMRRFSRETQRNYIRDVGRFAAFLGRSPDTAKAEDIRRFQMEQREPVYSRPRSTASSRRCASSSRNDRSAGPGAAGGPGGASAKLPVVLSLEEVGRLLNATPAASTGCSRPAYGAGLRVAEVAALKIGDIDSTRMLIRVEQGKGRKDRNAMLSPQLLELLRLWWREGKRRGVMLPQGWLFPGRTLRTNFDAPNQPLVSMRHGPLRSPSVSARTHCGTALPRICWRRMSTSVSSRFCSGTQAGYDRALRAGRYQDGPHGDQPSRQALAVAVRRIPLAEAVRASIEVADIFRAEGAGYRAAHAGHLNLHQLKVMSAIENCRTAALGGHVDACEDCGHWRIAYNSCLMGKFSNGESAGDPS